VEKELEEKTRSLREEMKVMKQPEHGDFEQHLRVMEKSVLGETEREINEKKKREPNIIMFGIPEQQEVTPEWRKKSDKKFVNNFMKEGCRMDFVLRKDVESMARLGKPDRSKMPRPLLVRFRELG